MLYLLCLININCVKNMKTYETFLEHLFDSFGIPHTDVKNSIDYCKTTISIVSYTIWNYNEISEKEIL